MRINIDILATIGATASIASIAGVYLVYRPPRSRADRVEESQTEFKRHREMLARHGHSLSAIASRLHRSADPNLIAVGTNNSTTDLLSRRDLIFPKPLQLTDIKLRWDDLEETKRNRGLHFSVRHVLPLSKYLKRYRRYSEALAEICQPSVFVNRISYRLVGIQSDDSAPVLSFGTCRYFEMIDTAQALAHELGVADTKTRNVSWQKLPLRRKFRSDVWSLSSRVVLPSIATLTLIRRKGRPWSFLLHWRDPKDVPITGGMRQVIPAGCFQPASIGEALQGSDFNLWRNVMREMAEELLGHKEAVGDDAQSPDYEHAEPYASLERARLGGKLAVWCFGLGMDPLTLTVEFLTAVVIDEDVFNDVFEHLVKVNAEGKVIGYEKTGNPPAYGIDFTEESVKRYVADRQLAPSGAACLLLAQEHREALIPRPS